MSTQAYRQMTLSSCHEDEKSIISFFKTLMEGVPKSTLKLLNIYKEIPIRNIATVVDVKASSVTFSTAPIQLAATELCAEAFIVPLYENYRVVAKLERVDFRHGMVTFNDFRYAEVMFDKRRSVRVRFKKPVNVVLDDAGVCTSGVIHDISLDGCCVSSHSARIFPGSHRLTVSLNFLDEDKIVTLHIPAVIVRSKSGLLRQHALMFHHTGETEKVLGGFIYRRQIEIIRELKERC